MSLNTNHVKHVPPARALPRPGRGYLFLNCLNKMAQLLYIFKNEQSLEALEEGRGTKIMAGPWRGEPLELGHFISPEINDTIQFHFSNRLILPETVKAAMEFADITKDVRDRADRMKRAKVLDVGSCDSIIRQYNTLRELSSRN